MTSKEALERIKSKYKGCLVKEAHNLPFSSDINIENIEEYWHIENKNDFSQIEKDLELLEILKKHYDVNFLEVSPNYFIAYSVYKDDEDFKKVKEWLENE